VLVVVVATGNHFFVDAVAGALAVALAATASAVLIREPANGRMVAFPLRRGALPATERRAA